jgi:hypothetical protein
MAKASVADRLEAMKGGYQNKQERLNAKLRQAKSIAKIAVHGNPSEEDIYNTLWCVLKMLEDISKDVNDLTPKDFEQQEEDGAPKRAQNSENQDA